MKPRTVVISLTLVLSALVVLVVISRLQIRELRSRADQYVEVCRRVQLAMHIEAEWFADPKRQGQALQLFAEGPSAHGYEDIALCIDRPFEFDRQRCWSEPNKFECLTKLAQAAEAAIAHHLE